jgi:hypothetical protein
MSYIVLIYLFSFPWLSFGNRHDSNNLIVESIEDAPVNIYPLAITYYSENQIHANVENTQYFVIHQCRDSTGNLAYVNLHIICAENPTLNTSNDQNFIKLELSNKKDVWDETTIFAVNYIYDIQNPVIFTSIGWEYNQQPLDIYGRLESVGAGVSITLLVTYDNVPNPNKGTFKKGYIPGSISADPYIELGQYIKANQIYEVNNNEHIVFNFSVCTRESIDPYKWDKYTLDVIVVSDLSAPLSAFDLAACAVTQYPNPADCTLNNIDAKKDEDASPLVSIQIINDDNTDLSGGVFLTVYGKGGNANGINKFLMEINILKN